MPAYLQGVEQVRFRLKGCKAVSFVSARIVTRYVHIQDLALRTKLLKVSAHDFFR